MWTVLYSRWALPSTVPTQACQCIVKSISEKKSTTYVQGRKEQWRRPMCKLASFLTNKYDTWAPGQYTKYTNNDRWWWCSCKINLNIGVMRELNDLFWAMMPYLWLLCLCLRRPFCSTWFSTRLYSLNSAYIFESYCIDIKKCKLNLFPLIQHDCMLWVWITSSPAVKRHSWHTHSTDDGIIALHYTMFVPFCMKWIIPFVNKLFQLALGLVITLSWAHVSNKYFNISTQS